MNIEDKVKVVKRTPPLLVNKKVFPVIVLLVIISLISWNFSLNLDNSINYPMRLRQELVNDEFMKLIDTHCDNSLTNNTYSCLDELKNHDYSKYESPALVSSIVHFHLFYEVKSSEAYYERLELTLLSYLATQDLNRTRMILWIDSDALRASETSKVEKMFEYYFKQNIFELKVYNLVKLCDNEIFNLFYKLCVNADKEDPIAFSDFFRFIVLYNYGGIYVDGGNETLNQVGSSRVLIQFF